jgi:hypothetical protein
MNEGHRDLLVEGDDLLRNGHKWTSRVETRWVPGEQGLKEGKIGRHTVYSDESHAAAGEDRWPSPLSYLAMATGW